MCLHIHIRTGSSFPGNFQVEVIIATFRLSWIDFALLTFLLTRRPQALSPDTGCVRCGGKDRAEGEQQHPGAGGRGGAARAAREPGTRLLGHVCRAHKKGTTSLLGPWASGSPSPVALAVQYLGPLGTWDSGLGWHCVHRSWEARHQAVRPPRISHSHPSQNHLSYWLAHTALFPTIFNGAKVRKDPEGSLFGLPGCKTVGRPGWAVGEHKQERAGRVLAALPGTERSLRSNKTSGLSFFGLLSQRKDGLCL